MKIFGSARGTRVPTDIGQGEPELFQVKESEGSERFRISDGVRKTPRSRSGYAPTAGLRDGELLNGAVVLRGSNDGVLYPRVPKK